MIRSLFWKEWREHRWKMLALLGVFLSLALAARISIARDPLAVFQDTVVVLAALVPIYVAMGTIAEERSDGTAEFGEGLPFPARRAFLIKSCFGLATAVAPMLLMQLVATYGLFLGERIVAMPALTWLLWPALFSAGIYAWTLALGAKIRSELPVVLVGLIVLACSYEWFFAVAAHSYITGDRVLRTVMAMLSPEAGYYYLRIDNPGVVALMVALQLLIIPSLMLLAVWRAGTPERPATRRAVQRPAALRISARRWPVLWKTWGELRWLVRGYMLGAIGILFFAAVRVWLSYGHSGGRFSEYVQTEIFGTPGIWYGDVLFQRVVVAGAAVAVVIGAQIGVADFEHRLDLFWQSRPISLRRYFWARFLFGLFLVIAMILLPLLLASLASTLWVVEMPSPVYQGWGDFRWGGFQWVDLQFWQHMFYTPQEIATAAFAAVPLACVGYAMAVFFGAVFRRRVLAMLFAVGCGLLLNTLLDPGPEISFDTRIWEWLYVLLVKLGFTHYFALELAAASIVVLAITAAIGWLAQLAFTGNWKERLEAALRRKEKSPTTPPLETA